MKIKKISQLNKFSISIANKLNVDDCLLLFGEIGVGKTTFARQLINYLQKKNNLKQSHVLSPTFNIVYDYELKSYKIMHYDLYRIKSEKEINHLGIFENSENCIKVIEWPELIRSKIENKLEIYFSYTDELNSRNIKVLGFGKWKKFKLDEI